MIRQCSIFLSASRPVRECSCRRVLVFHRRVGVGVECSCFPFRMWHSVTQMDKSAVFNNVLYFIYY